MEKQVDFTLKTYSELISALKKEGYSFLPFVDFLSVCGLQPGPVAPVHPLSGGKFVCLRHDVDRKPLNSLAVARLEAAAGVRATYYFRTVAGGPDEAVVRETASLGHETGYHYESLTTCRGDVEAAYEDFKCNLGRLRMMTTVRTACMHGSPLSTYDSRDIWKKYDYRALGIEGEPYLDTDWSRTFYLTDTGRRWDGSSVSVRDGIPQMRERWKREGLVFHSTGDIISRVPELPPLLMITTHPQRWSDDFMPWAEELMLQSAKNLAKKVLVSRRID